MHALETAMTALLALSVFVPLYVYAGYPFVLLGLHGLLGGRRPRARDFAGQPEVTMIVPAHDEAGVIADKVANFLKTDYPRQSLRLLVGSDGSTDGTVDAARAAAGDGRIEVLRFPERRGKASVVNDLVARATSPVVVISDANTMYRPDALARLVRSLSVAGTGAVCGRLVIRSDCPGACAEEGLYWRYENALKSLEGDLGSLAAINGQVLAFRRELFRPIPPDTITDDQHLGMAIMLDGWRVSFEPSAVAEEPAATLADERARRLRISAGNYQVLFRMGLRLMNPARGMVAFCYLSHKALRWVAPFCLPLGPFVNAALLRHHPARWLFAAQVAAFGAMALAEVLPALRRFAPLRLLHYFGAMNASMLAGFVAFAFKRQSAKWSRQTRV